MLSKKLLTLPNLLTFYRIASFPVVLAMALTGKESVFALLLIINLVTDVLDGLLARLLRMQTEFGARLDSIADIGTYILAVTGIFLFKADEFAPHITSFLVFLSLFIAANILSLIRFRRFPSLHLYSWKIGGYLQGAFFIVLFAIGFFTEFYYIMICWGILAFTEHIVIQLIIPEMKSNQKGLLWVLKNRHD
ncbi:MAG: CDP-alcohol phosphatidyltransferase family protein [Bacteroidales bacterium]